MTLFLKAVVMRLTRRRNPRRLPLPPGPAGYPIIGNSSKIPDYLPWEAYDNMRKEHGGDLLYFQGLGHGLLILGTRATASELLDKRASIYSSRPAVALIELLGLSSWIFGAMPYIPKWRKHRRAFHQHLNRRLTNTFHPIVYEERDAFLSRLSKDSKNWTESLARCFRTTTIRAVYGFEEPQKNDALVAEAQSVIETAKEVGAPGWILTAAFSLMPRFMNVDAGRAVLPLPGARMLRDMALRLRESIANPFREASEEVANGAPRVYPSLAAGILSGAGVQVDEETSFNSATKAPSDCSLEQIGRDVCATAYLAGSETTVASAQGIILALASHPDVQHRAQAEIDALLASENRLPLVSDRPNLPFVHAIVKEAVRWHTVVPLGFPRMNMEDDEYNGYFIPKGTYILPNTWAIMHDPEIFPNPFDFDPSRYINVQGKVDSTLPSPETSGAFGFGRRICPGSHFSDDALFIFVASLLTTFNITPPRDEHGNPIHLELKVQSRVVASPVPFECEFTVRPGREALVG